MFYKSELRNQVLYMNSHALVFEYPTYLILSLIHTYPTATATDTATVPVKLHIVHVHLFDPR